MTASTFAGSNPVSEQNARSGEPAPAVSLSGGATTGALFSRPRRSFSAASYEYPSSRSARLTAASHGAPSRIAHRGPCLTDTLLAAAPV